MKISRLLLCVAFVFVPVLLGAQAKIYTRKAKLEDFSVKTTKVVTDGRSIVEINFKNEVTSRWRVSPYEFCPIEDYDKFKNDNSYYFLRLVTEDGIAFLALSKGGKEDDADRLKKPFEVVRIPIGTAGVSMGTDIVYMGAFLDILQAFTEEAVVSDKTGYAGLELCNFKGMEGKTVCLGEASAESFFSEQKEDMLIPVCFAPEPEGEWCYKMLMDAGTHELFYFRRQRYKAETDIEFSDLEIKSFSKRHAELIR